jgi:alpha-glucosidase (family GH31 glycosyl hydrolase)
MTRRELLITAAALQANAASAPLEVAGRAVEITLTPVGENLLRITACPPGAQPPERPAFAGRRWPAPAARIRSLAGKRTIAAGRFRVEVSSNPLRFRIRLQNGRAVQDLGVDAATGALSFSLGDGPILGLGQGGPQFDRRGRLHSMRASHEDDRLLNGGRVPIPWLTGSPGWGLFLNRPEGDVDLRRAEGHVLAGADPMEDVFVAAGDPAGLMRAYAELTGFPSLPPLWTLGYQQSHRTLLDRDAMFSIARTLREKKLPCDALIYLGTGFAPSGWNRVNGSFEFNPKVFPDPPRDVAALHAQDFKVVLHVVQPPERLAEENLAAAYWEKHKAVWATGIDGWWPDEGEPMSEASRLARIRMYWEAPRLDRPDLRPYALHRTGAAGMQRLGGWLWSGDVFSNWEALRRQIASGLNAGMSGLPFWGTDIGGFFPTTEYTGELYVRWFQFAAFCPLFRSHGVQSYLHLPWGWNTGNMGPVEWKGAPPGSGLPDASELHNAFVEPVCRKYLELRYRLLPYLYSLVRQTHETGVPILRPMWLHYPDDPRAAARGDQYLWGRDMLVAPVTEKGAASRTLYLPRGQWYDFWTGAKVEGGRDIEREVNLETLPLYVRAGAILPMGPVKQHTGEKTDAPVTLMIYPGADGQFTLYEDDGTTFRYSKGEFTKTVCEWNDAARGLTLRGPARSRIEARLAPDGTTIVPRR